MLLWIITASSIFYPTQMAQAPGRMTNVPFNATEAMLGDVVPFFPSQRYIDKNLAPEKYPKEAVRAAAKAARQAMDAGVLTPEMATMILPNILTEGSKRATDFGVNNGRWLKGANAPIGKIVKSLGLESDTLIKEDITWAKGLPAVPGIDTSKPIFGKGDIVIQPKGGDTPEELAYNARLMTAVFAEKARIAGTAEGAVKGWNGIGKSSENHLKKVMETSQLLLDHAGNQEIMEIFKKAFLADPPKQAVDANKGKM